MKFLAIKILILFSFTVFLLLFSSYANNADAQSLNDWPTFQKNPQHTGFNAEETILQPPLSTVWTLTSPSGIYNNSIVVSGNTLYAKTNAGILYSIDASSGSINWQVQTQAGGSVAVANSIVYAASNCSGCSIDAFNPSTGQKLWSTIGYNPPISSGITVVGNYIYFGTEGPGWTFRAVDASTGNQIWGYSVTDAIFGFPALAAGNANIVYVSDYQRSPGLYALYQSSPGIGSSLWELRDSNAICGRYSPSVVNNVVYVSQSCGGSIIAFDATNGNRLWISESYHIAQTSTAFAYNTVYTRATDGVVSAIDSTTGYTRWTYDDNAPGLDTPVVVANGVVYEASTDNKINALDAQTGTLLWQYNTSGAILALIIANHTLFAGSSDGKIYAFGVNKPPVINSTPNTTINEGGTYSTNGSFNDPSSTSWTATVDYGDGSGTQPLTLSGTDFSLSHVYKDNGIFTVTVSVTDNQGATSTGSAIVTVNNITPTVGTITAPNDPVQVNTIISASASFIDPGVLDTHTAIWNWGDGTTSAGTVTETNGSGSVSDSHNYTAAGVYTITLTVTDKDGGVESSTFQYVVVYDPTAGYVTGAGTITSPTGAYTQDSSLSGKAIFGFVSRYQQGANVPEGSTQFRFIVANFAFKSTSYDWLVVGGARAQYKGSGTINGSGDYEFILTTIDGQINGGGGIDKFRIKITNKTTGNVIYDNQLGASDTSDPATAIDSGSITIHN